MPPPRAPIKTTPVERPARPPEFRIEIRQRSSVLWLLSAITGLIGVAYLAYSCLPYSFLRSIVDRLSSDGNAAGFTYDKFVQMRLGAFVSALATIAIASVLISAARAPRETRASWRRALASELSSMFSGWSRADYIVVSAGIMAALAVRLPYLHLPLRYDEAFTYGIAARGLIAVLCDYTYPNNQILHTVFVYLTTRIAGEAEWVVRLPALAAGLALCAVTYAVAKASFSRPAAVVALALAAVSPGLIAYSVNARGYTIQAVFSLLIVGIVRRWRTDPSAFGPRFLFTTAGALSLYLLPTSAYLLVLASAMFAIPVRLGELALRAKCFATSSFLAVAIAVLLYSPALVYSGLAAFTANRFLTPVHDPLAALAASLSEAATVAVLGWPWFLTAALLVGSVAACILRPPARSMAFGLLAVFVFAILQRGDPPSRVWTFAIPLAIVAAGAGIAYLLRSPALAYVSAAVVLATGLPAVLDAGTMAKLDYMLFNAPHAETLADVLNKNVSDADRVFVDNRYGPSLHYYMKRLGRNPKIFDVDSPATPNVLFIVCDQPVCTWASRTGPEGTDEGFGDLKDPGHGGLHHGLEMADGRYRGLAARWNAGRVPELSSSNRLWWNPQAAIHAVALKDATRR